MTSDWLSTSHISSSTRFDSETTLFCIASNRRVALNGGNWMCQVWGKTHRTATFPGARSRLRFPSRRSRLPIALFSVCALPPIRYRHTYTLRCTNLFCPRLINTHATGLEGPFAHFSIPLCSRPESTFARRLLDGYGSSGCLLAT